MKLQDVDAGRIRHLFDNAGRDGERKALRSPEDVLSELQGALDGQDEESALREPADELDMRMQIILIIEVIYRIQKNRVDAELRKFNLTAMQAQTLLYIIRYADEEKEITSRELERAFKVSNPTMSGVLKRLEKKGVIRRESSETDKRSKRIRFCGNEEIFWKEIAHRTDQKTERAFRDFTPEETQRLLQLIKKLLYNINYSSNEE